MSEIGNQQCFNGSERDGTGLDVSHVNGTRNGKGNKTYTELELGQ